MADMGMGAIMIAGAAMSAVGTGVSVMSSMQQGADKQSWYNYEAAQERQQAELQRQQYASAAAKQEKQNAYNQSLLRVAQATSGVRTGEGTPLLVASENAANAAIDVETIKETGSLAVQRSLTQATLSEMSGQQAYKAGVYGAGASLLTGAAGFASTYAMSQYYFPKK